MEPHIRVVFAAYIITPPFMPALVHQDEVEPVAVQFEMVAVGYGTLMFHAPVRRFYQSVAIFRERIWPEVILHSLKHFLHPLSRTEEKGIRPGHRVIQEV